MENKDPSNILNVICSASFNRIKQKVPSPSPVSEIRNHLLPTSQSWSLISYSAHYSPLRSPFQLLRLHPPTYLLRLQPRASLRLSKSPPKAHRPATVVPSSPTGSLNPGAAIQEKWYWSAMVQMWCRVRPAPPQVVVGSVPTTVRHGRLPAT